MPNIDLFIKSYRPDFWLLQYSLLSIKKWVTGYNNIILLIPEKDKEHFDTRNMPERTLIHYVEDKSPGWIWQQVCKLNAHKYSNADFIMFGDSDCFFTRPINLQDYVADDKPEILYTHYSKVGDALCWQKPTEEFMIHPVQYEYMRRNCLVYHRATLIGISEKWPNLEERIMKMERFSEFNLIGAYAVEYEYEKYNFVNTDDWIYTEPKAVQCWSHSRKNSNDPTNLKEHIRTLETIINSFGTGINLPE